MKTIIEIIRHENKLYDEHIRKVVIKEYYNHKYDYERDIERLEKDLNYNKENKNEYTESKIHKFENEIQKLQKKYSELKTKRTITIFINYFLFIILFMLIYSITKYTLYGKPIGITIIISLISSLIGYAIIRWIVIHLIFKEVKITKFDINNIRRDLIETKSKLNSEQKHHKNSLDAQPQNILSIENKLKILKLNPPLKSEEEYIKNFNTKKFFEEIKSTVLKDFPNIQTH
jgi:5-bromo-4-chloroindolyl phosphate hydrolysis protein